MLWDTESDSVKQFSSAAIINQHKEESTSKNGKQQQASSQKEEEDKDSSDSTYIMLPDQLSRSTINDQLDLFKELLGRCPVSHYWDPTESRLLVVEYEALRGESGKNANKHESWLASFGRTGKHAQVWLVWSVRPIPPLPFYMHINLRM